MRITLQEDLRENQGLLTQESHPDTINLSRANSLAGGSLITNPLNARSEHDVRMNFRVNAHTDALEARSEHDLRMNFRVNAHTHALEARSESDLRMNFRVNAHTDTRARGSRARLVRSSLVECLFSTTPLP